MQSLTGFGVGFEGLVGRGFGYCARLEVVVASTHCPLLALKDFLELLQLPNESSIRIDLHKNRYTILRLRLTVWKASS